MLALFVIAIAGLVLVGLSQHNLDFTGLESYARAQYQREHIVSIASGVESYYQETGTYPATLQALATTQGYQELRSTLEFNMGYATSAVLTDGSWQFKRAVAYLVPEGIAESVASYASKNYCGTGTVLTAISWCGDQRGLYYRRETRDSINADMTTQQLRFNRLQSKFVRYYNAHQEYPNRDGSNSLLAEGSLSSIASLVGYTGTPSACAGTFQYMGIPIDCGDIFDRWGNYTNYQFENVAHVIFISESPFINASGQRVLIAVDRK
jgi:hypothetical protein